MSSNLSLVAFLVQNDDKNITTQTSSTFAFAIWFISSFVVGIAANLLVIYIFLSTKYIRSHTSMFFINLSISDILVILVCVPVALTDLFLSENWYYGYIYCKLKVNFIYYTF